MDLDDRWALVAWSLLCCLNAGNAYWTLNSSTSLLLETTAIYRSDLIQPLRLAHADHSPAVGGYAHIRSDGPFHVGHLARHWIALLPFYRATISCRSRTESRIDSPDATYYPSMASEINMKPTSRFLTAILDKAG